jgi:RAD51-like protein 1
VSSLHKQGGDLHSNNDNVVNDDDLILLNGKISTGLPTLDGCLRGGIPIGSITEVVGRAGVGKTHLAQQLIVQAAMGGGGSIFIDAEKKLSLQRLRELALERRRRYVAVMMSAHTNTNQNSITDFAQQVLENVTIHSLLTTRELLDVLDNLEKEILLRNSEATNEGTDHTAASNNNNTRRLPVRLIVIDSIAAPIRRDFDMMGGSSATSSSSSSSSSSNTAANRASAIFQIAKRLKQLAYDHQLAVVVVNQVGSGHDNSFSSHNNNNNNQRNNTLDINDGEFTASLGTAWQYCATTRVVLEHEDDPHRLQQGGVAMHGNNNGLSIRSATLTKSLVSKKTRLTFELIQQGLVEVPTN